METDALSLGEVVVRFRNPADRIIKKAIENIGQKDNTQLTFQYRNDISEPGTVQFSLRIISKSYS